MKRTRMTFMVVTTAFCVAAAVFGLAACKDPCANGHNFSDWSTVHEASCTAEGERERVCTVCKEKEIEVISKIAHSFSEWNATTEATCVAEGARERVCSVCGENETESIALKPHSFDENDGIFCVACNSYYIASADDLRSLAGKTDFADRTVKLTADIDLAGAEWTPLCVGIRAGSSIGGGFNGVFDGNGKTISGLKISADPTNKNQGVGLFSAIKGGTVKNLTVNAEITLANNEMAGIIAGGMVDGLLENCTVGGSVASGRGVGGLVGRVLTKGGLRGCVNNAAVSGSKASGNVGGIVGAMYYVGNPEEFFIENCRNEGEVRGEGIATAGIVGFLTCGRAENCVNNGNVTAKGNSAGGIAGEAKYGAALINCVNAGDIHSDGSFVGGIAGWVRYNKDNDATYDSAQKTVEISDCRNSGRVSAKGYSLGGIIGGVYNSLSMKNCVNEGEVAGLGDCYMIGGLIGNFQNLDGNYFYGTGMLIAENCENKNASVTQEKTPDGMTHGVIGHVGENRVSFTDCTTVAENILGTGIPAPAAA